MILLEEQKHEAFAVLKLTTPYSIAEWDDVLRRLQRHQHGRRRLLLDARECAPAPRNVLEGMMAVWKTATIGMLDGRVALVVESDECYANAHLAQEIATELGMPFVLRPFRDIEAAERWLSYGLE